MRTRSVVLAVAGVATLGAGWITCDDDFGRPAKAGEEVERAVDLRTIPSPPMPDVSATFSLCNGPVRVTCVVDGDTFWFRGDKIRIADIDAPEIFDPHCAGEKQAGEAARDRLLALLNAGRFSLVSGWRDHDSYGRKLRNIVRNGKSLGETLVEEGLARRWDGPRWSWCER